MREILFKAKRVDNGDWVEGDYCEGSPNYHYISKSNGEVWQVCRETLCQFTGLTDKNGKKIFEGDVCRVVHYNHSHPDIVLSQCVLFENGTFVLKSTGLDDSILMEESRRYVPLYYCLPPNKIEIIGSIHDNPELLKPKP